VSQIPGDQPPPLLPLNQSQSVLDFYLGGNPDPANPAEVLGLSGSGPWTEGQVISALQARLRAVSDHAQQSAPQADEVRLALHAAAGKLITQGRAASAANGESSPIPPQFRVQILRLVAAGGGWSRPVMQRVMAMGAQQGIDPVQLANWLSQLQQAPGTVPDAQRDEAVSDLRGSRSRPDSGVMDPPAPAPTDSSRAVMMVVGWALGGLITVFAVAAAALIIIMNKPGGGPGAATPPAPTPAPTVQNTPGASATPTATASASPAASSTPAPSKVVSTKPLKASASETVSTDDRTHVPEWPDLVRAMELAVKLIREGNPDAVDAFSKAYVDLASQWPQATPDQRTSALSAVLDGVFAAAGNSEMSERLVAAIAATAVLNQASPTSSQVVPAVWTAGVVARISRERELPRALVRQFDELATGIFGAGGAGEATFDVGASAALLSMATRIVPGGPQIDEAILRECAQRWSKWLHAMRAVGGESVFYTQSVLTALDRLIVAGPEPTRDQAVFEAMTELTCAVSWRQDSPARRWLLSKFDSAAVSSDDLHVLTRALATQSGAPGVDATMVLGAGAGEQARAQLREKYAVVWAVSNAPERAVVFTKWLEAANTQLNRTDLGDDAFSRGCVAVALAHLNEAAHLLSGTALAAGADSTDAQSNAELLLIDPEAGLPKRLASLTAAATRPVIDPASTAWAVQYAAAQQRIPERLTLLGTVPEHPTYVEAKVLVEECCRGAPERVAQEAQGAVRRMASEPSIVCALLDFAPFIPQTANNSDTIKLVTGGASIPSIRDQSWRVAVRRALVERLLELLAGDSPTAIADAIGEALAESYSRRIRSEQVTPSKTPLTAEQASERLLAQNIQDAKVLIPSGREPISVSTIIANKGARERLASGRVQLFAAHQTTMCELLAYMTANERPTESDRVMSVLETFKAERQKSTHVLSQLHAAERAMLELWMIRLNVATAGGPQ
jgi:transposase-like protein